VTAGTGTLGEHVLSTSVMRGHDVRAIGQDPGAVSFPRSVAVVPTELSAEATEHGPLSGKIALVLGATRAGVATAQTLRRAGAAVVLADGESPGLEWARHAAPEITVVRVAPLGEPRLLRRLVASVVCDHGHLDFAVNAPPAAACRTIYLALTYELPEIVSAGGGAVVNSASESARVIALTQRAARAVADRGVRVNAVAAGGSPKDFATCVRWLFCDEEADASGTTRTPGARSSASDPPKRPANLALRKQGELLTCHYG
jgi:NAD(P)-dependent dehydrogenase (short-subunit alcohol dehydrogenase family)